MLVLADAVNVVLVVALFFVVSVVLIMHSSCTNQCAHNLTCDQVAIMQPFYIINATHTLKKQNAG